ncbi:hypothetical protein IT412_04650 [Candidatus Peregrinibacteria bacterium]|nr:hypothetical protein [Candidatus Peregrinibacteria bacterium]
MQFLFSKFAAKQWAKIPARDLDRIREKLEYWKLYPDLLLLKMKPVYDFYPATHRFRIGSWRLLVMFDQSRDTLIILKIGARKEIYK